MRQNGGVIRTIDLLLHIGRDTHERTMEEKVNTRPAGRAIGYEIYYSKKNYIA